MKRDSSRVSLRWYFSTSRLNACLSPSLRPRDQLTVDLAVAHARAPHPGLHDVFNAYVPQTRPLGNSSTEGRRNCQAGSCAAATPGSLPQSAQMRRRRNSPRGSMSAVTSSVRGAAAAAAGSPRGG